MIIGIGVDIQEVSLIEEGISLYGIRYVQKFCTPKEIKYCESGTIFTKRVAARIAAKEAAVKAFGTGMEDGLDWLDFEIVNEESGRPTLLMNGNAAKIHNDLKISASWVSLSHSDLYVVAQVILEA